MCRLDLIYTRDELKALDKKAQAALKKLCVHMVRTSPEIVNIIKKDPRIRRKLKSLLRGKYNRLTRA
jgi:hypothetical protein